MSVSPRSRRNMAATITFLTALRKYLGRPLAPEDCRHRILGLLRDRQASTLRLFREGIYAESGNPYLRLLQHAGVTYDDVAELVRTEGVEGALAKLTTPECI